VNPCAIQEAMGHKSLETTMGYLHAEALSVCSPLELLGAPERQQAGFSFPLQTDDFQAHHSPHRLLLLGHIDATPASADLVAAACNRQWPNRRCAHIANDPGAAAGSRSVLPGSNLKPHLLRPSQNHHGVHLGLNPAIPPSEVGEQPNELGARRIATSVTCWSGSSRTIH
jgi:hypothetical protein